MTSSIERFSRLNRLSSAEPVEVFAAIGSREQYADGASVGGRLLVIEPHGEGPYQRALDRRGPGLHHLGVAVAGLAEALVVWMSWGWQVHPASGEAVAEDRGAFLYQRGVPTLVELFVGRMDLGAPATSVVLATGPERLPALAGVQASTETAVWHWGRRLALW